MSEHTVTLNNGESSCKVHLFGATVTSWVSGGQERLFLSSEAKMDGTKAIRGGIPIVFPNFGPWECGPQHGFARISWWTVSSQPAKLDNGDTYVVLELCDDEITRNMWDYSFKLQYSITLSGSTLSCKLNVTNTFTKPFDFTTLLHTYIRVDDIKQTTISGFQNCAYVDKVESNEGIEVNNEVKITKNVDRVYAGTVGHTVKHGGGCVRVEKSNLPDTVLWNPWVKKAQTMSDFPDDGWNEMVCVEPGAVSNRVVLPPDSKYVCSQLLSASL